MMFPMIMIMIMIMLTMTMMLIHTLMMMKDAGEEGDDDDTFFHEGAIGLIRATEVLTPEAWHRPMLVTCT